MCSSDLCSFLSASFWPPAAICATNGAEACISAGVRHPPCKRPFKNDPQPGKSDADRDLICMITTHGGTNPLEADAYVVEVVKRMIQHSASSVKLRALSGGED